MALWGAWAWAAGPVGVVEAPAAPLTAGAATDARAWLARIHAAANGRNYQGLMTFTVGSVVSSSSVAHFCVDNQVYERIETLDGKPRQVYRTNDVVHTVWPQSGMAIVERRSPLSALPSSTQSVEPRALEQYELLVERSDRVAGRPAQVLLLRPRDGLRFAQRLWADDETGLMLRSDVLDPSNAIIESTRFVSVEVGVAPQRESVTEPIRRLDRLRVMRPQQTATQLEAQGWRMARPVAGFVLATCVRRHAEAPAAGEASTGRGDVLQAVYSDGLTHVSLFIEPFDAGRHRNSIQAQFGATYTLALRRGDHWVTAMGDVPPATLRQFVDGLERRP